VRYSSLDDLSAALSFALKDGKVGVHAKRSPGKWLLVPTIGLGIVLAAALLRRCSM
jgi:hypothetical protein